ncbi:hypothetical protein CEXT_601971 [Caerostris extrusa]|uniref:Ycf15 n=1 Tax=Caerostris extrusa TaxID=172846 RepID=A0AAV4NIV1_CAEEX|nr:hypothetical protein CEXT_601971 [Caerostris extrusa]
MPDFRIAHLADRRSNVNMHRSSGRVNALKAGKRENGACQLFLYCRPHGYSSEPSFAPGPTIFAFKRFFNNNKNSETTPRSKRY